MTVSNIHIRNLLCKKLLDFIVGLPVPYYPEVMTYPVFGNEVILGSLILHDLFNNLVKFPDGRVCKEHRFNVGIVCPDMDHPVFLLVRTGQLMLFDYA